MGTDGIYPLVLKSTANTCCEPLSYFFQKSFNEKKIPNKWREANITPIFKSGSRMESSNYRPVSLTSVVSKVMERLIQVEILFFLESNSLISSNQHGFRPGKSCITNLIETFDFLSEANKNKMPVDAIFLDFSKAFDTVPHRRLIHKLASYGLDQNLIGWIQDFLSQRKQRVVLGHETST